LRKCRIPDLTLLPDGIADIHSGKKVRFKYLIDTQAVEHVVNLVAIGQRNTRLLNVAGPLSRQGQSSQGRLEQQRFQQGISTNPRN